MMGTTLYFANHCKLPFGAYTEAHEEYPQTNTMAQRTRAVICLGQTGNFQGSYKMMCIQTGRKVTRKQFKELPIPDSVIYRIKAIASKEKENKVLVFTDRDAYPIGDNGDTAGVDDDTDDDNNNDNDNDEGNANNPPGILLDETAGANDEDNNNDNTDMLPVTHYESAGVPDNEITGVSENEDSAGVPDNEITGVPENESETADSEDIITGDDDTPETTGVVTDAPGMEVAENTGVVNNEEDEVEQEPNMEPYNPDTWTPSVQRVHGIRPRKGRTFSHLHAMVMHHAMTQYSLKKGLKNFKEVGEEAVPKELLQLHMRDTFKPQNVKVLSSEQKKVALESLMFLKKNATGQSKEEHATTGVNNGKQPNPALRPPQQRRWNQSSSPPSLRRSKAEKWQSSICRARTSALTWMKKSSCCYADDSQR
jgi:hypothetical protein